jgi:ABC-type lipoprotein export system ATPase subunit
VAEPLVELCNVSRIYGEVKVARFAALDGIDLTLDAGEIRAVVGPSGSGKTTLLQILGLLDSPTSGIHRFMGHDVAIMDDAQRTRLRACGISFMFQENWLIPWLTAQENVLAPQVHLGPVTSAHHDHASELLDRLGIGGHAHKRVTQLSGGQRQRVCMARALLKKPRLVIADEPSASLDSHTSAEILDLFLDLREREGCAILIATHDPALIGPLESSVIHLRDGRITS